MIKAIIIDDDSNLRQGLQCLLKQIEPEIKVLAQAEEVKQGVQMLIEYQPDVVFLDIQLTDGTGFDILEQYQNSYGKPSFQVVFITAYEQFALKAFRFSALDYLLKPVDIDDLQTVIERIKQNKNNATDYKSIEVLLEHLSKNNDFSKRIAIPTTEGVHLFEINNIVRLESSSNYTTFHLQNKETLMASKTMKEYEELLTQYGFERIHQSHLINIKYLKSFLRKESYVVMSDGKHLPVAVRKKDRLNDIINKL